MRQDLGPQKLYTLSAVFHDGLRHTSCSCRQSHDLEWKELRPLRHARRCLYLISRPRANLCSGALDESYPISSEHLHIPVYLPSNLSPISPSTQSALPSSPAATQPQNLPPPCTCAPASYPLPPPPANLTRSLPPPTFPHLPSPFPPHRP